jgi:hypothetical protein
MAIYVDRCQWPDAEGKLWCHMMSDGGRAELDAFARKLGLRLSWIQKPGTPQEHYDLTASKRTDALHGGAIAVDSQTMFRLCVNPKRQAAKEAIPQ